LVCAACAGSVGGAARVAKGFASAEVQAKAQATRKRKARAARDSHNKSQQEIAEQVGCTKQYVGQLKAEISKQVYLPPTRTDSIGRTRPTSYAKRKPTMPTPLPGDGRGVF